MAAITDLFCLPLMTIRYFKCYTIRDQMAGIVTISHALTVE